MPCQHHRPSDSAADRLPCSGLRHHMGPDVTPHPEPELTIDCALCIGQRDRRGNWLRVSVGEEGRTAPTATMLLRLAARGPGSPLFVVQRPDQPGRR